MSETKGQEQTVKSGRMEWSAVKRLVILPISIAVSIWGKLTAVDKKWWQSTPGYASYTKRPDYKRYQLARMNIGRYPFLEKTLLAVKAI